MKRTGLFAGAAILMAAIAVGQAQQAAPAAAQPAANQGPRQLPDPTPPDNLPRPSTTDPRSNLKPGAVGSQAAEAAGNIELVANLPKPEGFTEDQPLGFGERHRTAGGQQGKQGDSSKGFHRIT